MNTVVGIIAILTAIAISSEQKKTPVVLTVLNIAKQSIFI